MVVIVKEIKIIKSELLSRYPELKHGFSTRTGNNRGAPYYFNLSKSVGDDEAVVMENRELFFKALGTEYSRVATQFQVHGTGVSRITSPGYHGQNDAMVTNIPNIVLTVTSADCVPVLVYDPVNHVIAAIHSGWRGSSEKIITKVFKFMEIEYGCECHDFRVFLGPSISQKNYEVGEEVAEKFDDQYLIPEGEKFFLDVPGFNRDLILDYGVLEDNLEVSKLCSYEELYLHSYRRDGKLSGRAMGAIMLTGDNTR